MMSFNNKVHKKKKKLLTKVYDQDRKEVHSVLSAAVLKTLNFTVEGQKDYIV